MHTKKIIIQYDKYIECSANNKYQWDAVSWDSLLA